MDWVIFGDDWGAHPSTTQHLALNLPGADRVVWLDSIGMRDPKLHVRDLRRILTRAKNLTIAARQEDQLYSGTVGQIRRVSPAVLPWHSSRVAAAFNRRQIGRLVRRSASELGMDRPMLLACNPVVAQYLDSIRFQRCAYLRLDDYERLPGVNRELIQRTEPMMFDTADVVFATAKPLLPGGKWAAKASYLPQGVDCRHFARVGLDPPRRRVLGFFGLIAEWIDFGLIERVARLVPEWRLDFLGPVRYLPEAITREPNVRFLPAVPFGSLPDALNDWDAAWIPFEVSELTKSVNPLKAREFLAAGLPTISTPMPEVAALAPNVSISANPEEIAAWLETTFATDSRDARLARRRSVEQDSWSNRCQQLRDVMSGLAGR